MRVTMKSNIERFPSKQMYPYLSLVERNVAEFYHNIDRRGWLVWVKMTYFHRFFWTIHGVLDISIAPDDQIRFWEVVWGVGEGCGGWILLLVFHRLSNLICAKHTKFSVKQLLKTNREEKTQKQIKHKAHSERKTKLCQRKGKCVFHLWKDFLSKERKDLSDSGKIWA